MAPECALLVTRRPLGVLEFLAIDPATETSDAVLRLMVSLMSQAERPARLVVNAIGYGGVHPTVHAIAVSDGFRLIRPAVSAALPPGEVGLMMSDLAPPGTEWLEIGTGGAADVLGWIASALTSNVPGQKSEPAHIGGQP